jgi:hypothetical protein
LKLIVNSQLQLCLDLLELETASREQGEVVEGKGVGKQELGRRLRLDWSCRLRLSPIVMKLLSTTSRSKL